MMQTKCRIIVVEDHDNPTGSIDIIDAGWSFRFESLEVHNEILSHEGTYPPEEKG